MKLKADKDSKLLVLSVDRDDDIGEKGNILTPILGRESCLKAASALALSDPEEADANAIFSAIKQYDDLIKQGYKCEVAVISGKHSGGFEADKKVKDQITKISKNSEYNGVILVSDGAEDEMVIPIIQNFIPVISVIRVVIKHSKGVEQTYAILGRYLNMLVYDSRYSKIALGVPGIFLLLSSIAVILGQERIVSFIALALIGVTFLIRGFSLDKWFESLPKLRPSGYVRLFSSMASVLIIATSFYTAFVAISVTEAFLSVQQNSSLIWEHGAFLFGKFIQESLIILWIGISIYFGGGVLVNYLKGSIRMVSNGVAIVIFALLYLPVLQFSEILTGTGNTATLISFLLIGFAIIFLTVTVVYMYIRSRKISKKDDQKLLQG